ncbi:hypothetical protein [Paraburkholderia sartisoli]|uniref:Uncharacterized protein n=1 Tax=Paraburkholderia sartisoli TaxID=83784 RepID=A0A1H4A431_9BURK|nr:hypothetical protein [Paraburkholderia sartisoli]SEA30411.1 hypothetical protein SAMN05192564_1011010 [Paraburkholderia sartisoli]
MNYTDIPKLEAWKRDSWSWTSSRSTNLKRIDVLIEKYHQVLITAKINILMELMTAIKDWATDKYDRKEGSRRLPAMVALENVVIAKLNALDNRGGHRYSNAVCIGYAVKTGAYDPRLVPANHTTRINDEEHDLVQRCKELIKAIRVSAQCYEMSAAKESDAEKRKSLKIFMAPEFFFRGPYGAYADIGCINKIFDTMALETSQNVYRDWLFVFGTAICSSDKELSGLKLGNLLENYALVQRGGGNSSEANNIVVAKEFPSHIDFKHPGVTDHQWFDPAKSKANIAGVSEKHFMPEGARRDPIGSALAGARLSELVGGCIFTMDGIRFGLEVCRDHHLQRLKNSKEAGIVHIQLIPSAGMSISAGAIACVPNGIVFNVDGVTPHVQLKVGLAIVQTDISANQSRKIGNAHIRVFNPAVIPLAGVGRKVWPRSL